MNPQAQQKIVQRHGPLVSSKTPDKASSKGNFSVEDSGPPSPHSGTVNNFGQVAPGIYRSSFPYPENVEHLRSLKLKTILTLVDTEHSPEFNDFVQQGNIRHIRILVPAHKTASVVIPIKTILEIQGLLADKTNHPLLIHCNKGKHRTGCMIACYRRLHGWTNPAIITEYRKFAGAKFRPLDEAFIISFNAKLAAEMLNGAKVAYAPLVEQTMLPTPPPSDRSVDGNDEWVDQSEALGMGQILAL